MNSFSLEWIKNVLNNKALYYGKNTDIQINSISTDSRTIKKNDIFVALNGENFNGHDFIEDAIKKGACGAVINKTEKNIEAIKKKIKENTVDFFLFETNDTLYVLQEIARFYRQNLSIKIIGITGSNGKTTTKDMTHAVLSTAYRTYKSEANFNNEIGVPHAILNLGYSYEAAVLEFGMTHKGDIRRLVEIASPQIRILTNIGPAHLQNFSSINDIAEAKAEIFELSHPEDMAVINIDDELIKQVERKFNGRKITYGLNSKAEVKAEDINNNTFTLKIYDKFVAKISLPILGIHNIYNALSAISAGILMEISYDKIVNGITSFSPPSGRMELLKFNGLWVINDAYNANPISMKRALETFHEIFSDRQKILILGDMLELGEEGIFFHKEIGKQIAQMKVNYLFTFGKLANYIARSAVENGIPQKQVFQDLSAEEIAEKISKKFSGKDVVLIKGSRAMGMEKVIDCLRRNYINAEKF